MLNDLDENGDVYTYEIQVLKKQEGFFRIGKERLQRETGKNRAIFEFDGQSFNFNPEYSGVLLPEINRQLEIKKGLSSVVPIFFECLKDYMSAHQEQNDAQRFMGAPYASIFLLSSMLSVFLHKEDVHETTISKKVSERIISAFEKTEDKSHFFKTLFSPFHFNVNEDVVEEDKLSEYKKNIENLSHFLHVFKPDLKGIRIIQIKDGHFIRCRKEFDYGTYRVDEEFESNGLKHLVRIHGHLQSCINGSPTFIDELDVNLCSVYLSPLLKFMSTHARGQLIFTAHNLDTMEILRKNGGSIDSIGINNVIDSWTNNGNSNPAKAYRNGLYEGLPFNVEPFDFLTAFEMGDEK
ncbi:MAG: hypothetical protein MJ239_07405 [Bacilli bacterium]|nr:hypothetical protein [Bacilli bacterium]